MYYISMLCHISYLNTVGTCLARLVLLAVQAAPIIAWLIVLALGRGPPNGPRAPPGGRRGARRRRGP